MDIFFGTYNFILCVPCLWYFQPQNIFSVMFCYDIFCSRERFRISLFWFDAEPISESHWIDFTIFHFFQGDFTRTGERKISGLMKDGYKSANRLVFPRLFFGCLSEILRLQIIFEIILKLESSVRKL